MKKLIILATLLLVSVLNANAQFSIGAASGGVLGMDTNENATFAPGYFGELQFRLIMKNEWYVTATPRFESSSYQSKASSPYTFYYFTNSMEFPFHFGHRTPLSDKMMLYYDLGPSLHWIMTNDYHGSVYGVYLSSMIHPIDLGYVKRFNLDMGATVGVDIWNHMKVFVGGDFGVLPEQRPAFLENFEVSPTHPFSVRLGLGVYFSFKKRHR